MKCFGSCQFLRGLWMDLSREVAKIHMSTDANNLVTTARRIHLLEQKETIHMISMFRKEACSGSIHDLAHIPTRNCLADCLTEASAKADNLITAVQAGKLLDVEILPDFRTLWSTRPSCQLGAKHCYTQEKRKSSSWTRSSFFLYKLPKKDHSRWCLWGHSAYQGAKGIEYT